jgi:hypothetical protein
LKPILAQFNKAYYDWFPYYPQMPMFSLSKMFLKNWLK